MQLTLTILAVIISIFFLYKKFIHKNSDKGCDNSDCGCK
ncbi:MAG TPA: FeoB-associated Cys-rich membrane protein [Cytophagales bacterium]|nr:FeoB-associated Cys-rich membrane protein [Cytophagales bacterium]